VHPIYDREADRLHDPLSNMIVSTNLYLKLPASTYEGRRFVVVIEPLLSPRTVECPASTGPTTWWWFHRWTGRFAWAMCATTYLHYVIERCSMRGPTPSTVCSRFSRRCGTLPLEFRYRNDTVPLTIECLIKAIEARTMDTGVPVYTIPAAPRAPSCRVTSMSGQIYQQKVMWCAWPPCGTI